MNFNKNSIFCVFFVVILICLLSNNFNNNSVLEEGVVNMGPILNINSLLNTPFYQRVTTTAMVNGFLSNTQTKGTSTAMITGSNNSYSLKFNLTVNLSQVNNPGSFDYINNLVNQQPLKQSTVVFNGGVMLFQSSIPFTAGKANYTYAILYNGQAGPVITLFPGGNPMISTSFFLNI